MGKFISFEGIDGSGKSTQLHLTAEWLRGRGVAVQCAFEPGDGPLCAEIRKLLLNGEHKPVPEAELLLFLADRAHHVRTVIQPALHAGQWVLCDRFSDSTWAYQQAGRALVAEKIAPLLEFAELGCRPDLTLWLDLPVVVSQKKTKSSLTDACQMSLWSSLPREQNRFDLEKSDFIRRVGDGFRKRHEAEPERIVRIPAQGTIDEVQEEIQRALGRLLCDS